MTELLVADGKVINTYDLREYLEQLGVRKDDVICVHSHLMSFGKPLLSRQIFLESIIRVLRDTIGEKGTLIMPSFTYSFCRNEVYDVEKSPSRVGILTEYYRKQVDVKRTWHPIFSFVIGGNKQQEYLDIGPDAFSFDSVYGKMMRDNGKIILLGGNYGYTFYHLAEEHLNVSHRYFKNFSGTIVDRKKKYLISVPYFVRDLSIKSDLDEQKLSQFLVETECQKQVDFAKGTIAVFDCKNAYLNICNQLKINEKSFI